MSWLQWNHHWLQVELDKLYRFHYLLFPTDPLLPLKNAKYRENQWKSQYFFSGFAHELTPIRPTLAPSRTRQALSIPLFTFSIRPALVLQKCQIPQKTLKFENYRPGFALGRVPMYPMMGPDRSCWDLSISHFIHQFWMCYHWEKR